MTKYIRPTPLKRVCSIYARSNCVFSFYLHFLQNNSCNLYCCWNILKRCSIYARSNCVFSFYQRSVNQFTLGLTVFFFRFLFTFLKIIVVTFTVVETTRRGAPFTFGLTVFFCFLFSLLKITVVIFTAIGAPWRGVPFTLGLVTLKLKTNRNYFVYEMGCPIRNPSLFTLKFDSLPQFYFLKQSKTLT